MVYDFDTKYYIAVRSMDMTANGVGACGDGGDRKEESKFDRW